MLFDLSKAHCQYFQQISQIPHGSGNESALSEWIAQFAQSHGLCYIQDEIHNIVVYKPAGPGCETHPAVLLQAHMDMVCVKAAQSRHDFSHDPLELYVEGTHLRARGTSLGADDGMGCAYMLAILADPTLQHPPLECCFTVQEETGLQGAQYLKASYFQARRMVNLDGAGEHRTYVSMGGGTQVRLHRTYRPQFAGGQCYRLLIDGLLGGHSGGMIDKERACASGLLGETLHALQQVGPVQLAAMRSGSKPNVIAGEGCAEFCSDAPPGELGEAVNRCENMFRERYEFADPDIAVWIEPVAQRPCEVLSPQDSHTLIRTLCLLPFGQLARNLEFDIPRASANPGVVEVSAQSAELLISLRSDLQSWIDRMLLNIRLLAEETGFAVEIGTRYPGWKYDPHSPLRETLCTVYEELYGKPLACLAGHGGNECGVFQSLIPEMDIVTSGAIYGNIHSTDEYLDLESFDRAYTLLTRFLERL